MLSVLFELDGKLVSVLSYGVLGSHCLNTGEILALPIGFYWHSLGYLLIVICHCCAKQLRMNTSYSYLEGCEA